MKILSKFTKNSACLFLVLFGAAVISFGQTPRTTPTPTLIIPRIKENLPIATGNNLNCAGYIQKAPMNTNFEIVGSNQEREQNVFAEGDYVYISRGRSHGGRVGDVLAVVRPRGQFSSQFSRKGNLGIYVQEVGTVEIVKVKEDVAVARVKNSCQAMLMGDLIVPVPVRISPTFQARPALDIFGEPSGKQMGRIVLARDGRETLARDEIVYIDLGAEDNVQIGDYLTIFRRLGKGGVINSHQDESVSARDKGFQSKVYRGGTFSNQAPRKSGDMANGPIVTTKDAKRGRQKNLREVVGEMVIINVKERTATAVITRGVTEIHTGDMVEIQ